MNVGGGRPSSAGRLLVTGILEGAALAASVYLLGLPLVVPVFLGLVAAAASLRGFSPATVFIAAHAALGLVAAVYLVADYLYWLLQLLGAGAVLVIVNHFAAPRQPVPEVT